MKTEALKKLIKEAVREVLLEEREVLQEITTPVTVVKDKEKPAFYKDLVKPTAEEATSSNVISEMINMTKSSMTHEDYKSILNANSSMVSKPNFAMNSIADNIPAGPQPGLDISNLDFVKNAASIFKLAEKKSQNR